jgi:hypothetical protein
MSEEPLIEINNERFDELYNLAKAIHPNVADYFIHLICNEQCVFETGYENEEVANELYDKAKEQLKKNEYYFDVEREKNEFFLESEDSSQGL